LPAAQWAAQATVHQELGVDSFGSLEKKPLRCASSIAALLFLRARYNYRGSTLLPALTARNEPWESKPARFSKKNRTTRHNRNACSAGAGPDLLFSSCPGLLVVCVAFLLDHARCDGPSSLPQRPTVAAWFPGRPPSLTLAFPGRLRKRSPPSPWKPKKKRKYAHEAERLADHRGEPGPSPRRCARPAPKRLSPTGEALELSQKVAQLQQAVKEESGPDKGSNLRC